MMLNNYFTGATPVPDIAKNVRKGNTMPLRDCYTSDVSGAADFDYDDGPTLADVSDDGIDRDEDDLFAVDARGNCTMCGGDGRMDNCPGMCSHVNCDEWECPQCEGEKSRIIEDDDDEEDENDLLPRLHPLTNG